MPTLKNKEGENLPKQIAEIPFSNIDRIEIYVAKCTKTVAQAKKVTGADYVMNGGMWNPDGSPCRGLKVDGKLLSNTPWNNIPGMGWNSPNDFVMTLKWQNYDNFIACSQLIQNKQKVKINYDSAMGGTRGRTALGYKGDNLVMYVSQDGSGCAKTPEKLQEELINMGVEAAIMLDGGGSSQCDFRGKRITGDGRKVHNWICVFLKNSNVTPKPDENETEESFTATNVNKNYKVTPDVGLNIRSGPSSSYSLVGGYSKGTVINVTQESNGWGKTNLGWVSLEYCEEIKTETTTTTRVTDNGIKIKQILIPSGAKNRPGGSNPMTSITIHETGNFAAGADADAHGSYLKSSAGANSQTSWHYSVDDHSIVQHLPDNEKAWHAGDGANGQGNSTSISIEICVNSDGDFNKAMENAASLVRLLKSEHSSITSIVQHNHWNGKDCPYTIRHKNLWDSFLKMCNEAKDVTPKFEQADDWAKDSWLKAYQKGITDGTRPKDTITRQEVMVLLDRCGCLD